MIKPFNGCFDAACHALRFLADHPRPAGGEQEYNSAHLFQIADEIEKAQKDDLTTAPGAADLTFGSLLSHMISNMFSRVDGRAGPSGRHYMECSLCDGTDEARPKGQRPSQEQVQHEPDCLLHKHMPRLLAMANKDVT